MAAFKSKAQSSANPHDTSLIIEKTTKPRKPRRTRAKHQDPSRPENLSEPSSSSRKPEIDSGWSWTSLTEPSASDHPAVFTKDGSYFFSIVGSSVKICASSTGRVISTLSLSSTESSVSRLGGHKDMIISAVLNPHNTFQLITASMDGYIRVWDYLDAVLLRTIDLEQPILHMAVHEKFKDCVFVAVSLPTKKKNSKGNPTENNAMVLKVSLKLRDGENQSPVQTTSDTLVIGKTRRTAGLALSSDGSWLVAIAGHKAYVSMTSDLKSGFTKFVSTDRLTCLAFHPTEHYFATGDAKGAIKLWYCLNEGIITSVASGVEKRCQTTAFHWHAHPVSSIAFTPNGAYLLSGGEESVLVIWQLHTGKKEFVPRVGAPILSVSVRQVGDREEEYLLGLSDTTYTFVSSGSLRVSRAFSRIKLGPVESHDRLSSRISVPLAIHPSTSSLILPSSHPSSLQAYSPSDSTCLFEVEVSPSNRVSRTDETPLEPSRVRQVVVSTSGEWMATVDDRDGGPTLRSEIYLKIWQWDRKSGFWILNTRVDRPHGSTMVTSISFNTSETSEALQLVTTGQDGQIKLWRIKSTKSMNAESEEFWVPRSTFSFRSETPSNCSWSRDSSLLAVSLGPYVSLYDPVTYALRQVLTCPECPQVLSCHFLGKGGRYLAVVGRRDLVLWDLISQSIRWHHRSAIDIDHIIPHPMDDTLVLLQSSTPLTTPTLSESRVLLFRSSCAIPYRSHTIPFRISNAIWYQAPPVRSNFSLVGITDIGSVVVFGDNVEKSTEDGSTLARTISAANASPRKSTIFQEMFGISAFSDFRPPTLSSTMPVPQFPSSDKKQLASTILDAPAYLIPPLETLFDPLIGSYLELRSENQDIVTASSIEDPENEEDQMDVDKGVSSREKPFLIDHRSERIVDAQEMSDLVELFKEYGLISLLSHRNNVPKIHSNGINKQNGASHVGQLTTNGIDYTPMYKVNGHQTSSTSQEVHVFPPTFTSTMVGKKRKKRSEETQ